MKQFKFFQKENNVSTDNARDYWGAQRQVYVPLQLTRVEQVGRQRTINEAIRHEEYLHNIQVRDESVVDWGQMARDIREGAQLRDMVNRTIERPNELLHRGRRPRNSY